MSAEASNNDDQSQKLTGPFRLGGLKEGQSVRLTFTGERAVEIFRQGGELGAVVFQKGNVRKLDLPVLLNECREPGWETRADQSLVVDGYVSAVSVEYVDPTHDFRVTKADNAVLSSGDVWMFGEPEDVEIGPADRKALVVGRTGVDMAQPARTDPKVTTTWEERRARLEAVTGTRASESAGPAPEPRRLGTPYRVLGH